MKTAEIKELTIEELQERLQTLQAEYNQMVINHAVSPLDNPANIRQRRRDIARMRTILAQRLSQN